MTAMQNIIHYWRTSLRDAERMGFGADKLKGAQPVSRAALAQGQVSAAVVAAIYAEHSGSKNNQRPAQGLEIVICPLVAKRRSTGYERGEAITPLWIPAILKPSGELAPKPDSVPWIARNVLEPSERTAVMLGLIDDQDRFLARHPPFTDASRWSDLWGYATAMLQAVTGMALETFQITDYEVESDTAYLLVADSVQGTAQHILGLYDRILEGQRFPPLLARYAASAPVVLRPLLAGAQQQQAALLHTGQMRSEFPLSASQRESLHHYLAIGDGELLAINGPPGTGKTTLIQSVVATLWVNAALQGGDPPVIVAASTNNQAVTNVIQSFAMGTDRGNRGPERWIPNIHSYGLYCVSKRKEAEAVTAGFQLECVDSERQRSGLFAELETPAALQMATAAFLDRCTTYVGQRVLDVNQAADMLRNHLADTVQRITQGTKTWGTLTDAQRTIERYNEHGGVDACSAMFQREYHAIQDELRRLKETSDGWRTVQRTSGWLWPFSLLPAAKRRVDRRNRDYFASVNLVLDLPLFSNQAVDQLLRQLWDERGAKGKALAASMQCALEDKQRLQQARHDWAQWCATNNVPVQDDPQAYLDTTLRFRAFELATHYWEARWLSEVRQRLASPREDTNLRSSQEKRWRRYAKLTPCFVSTLYMAPRFFSAWEQRQALPLFEYIDLLIIDEAGQVSPDVAGAMFALAKKALVVGDIHQIEPVWIVTRPIDVGNLKRSGVADSPEKQAAFTATGMSAANGSVMRVAQYACPYQKSDRERGMFLAEHRRCVPEIIAYCNELAYDGRLEPTRLTKADRVLPALGYAHINGSARRVQGSWENQVEAACIVQWIAAHRQQLESHYKGQTIGQIVGIVTPFARQTQQINTALRQQRIDGVTVGTVHALQGAERPVVLFSPVYDEFGTFFFDRNVNMLNVAVSRAKDSFLVFGNMVIFQPHPASASHRDRPSSLLARYLFASPTNELPISARWTQAEANPPQMQARMINTLADHRMLLTQGLQQARQRVLIISPQLSEWAIKVDRINHLITAAVQRGVVVEIYTDRQLDIDPNTGQLRPNAVSARQLLPQCGAQLHIIDRIHNKTLCIDDQLLVIGSFNWLSAIRDETHAQQRHEESLKYEGTGVAAMITQVQQEMQRRLNPSTPVSLP